MTVQYDPARHVPDLNHWEGNINALAMFAAGVPRLITKLTDGYNFGDPGGAFLIRHALALGKPVETYHFPRPLDDLDAQLVRYRDALWGSHLTAQTSQTWMDFEAKGFPLAWRPLGVLRIRALFRPFVLKVLRRSLLILGTIPGVYTGMSFWNSYIGRVDWAAEGLNEPELWAADMGYDREGSGITEPRWVDKSTWSRGWKRWQFTDHGRVPGVPGACDLNFERP